MNYGDKDFVTQAVKAPKDIDEARHPEEENVDPAVFEKMNQKRTEREIRQVIRSKVPTEITKGVMK